MLILFFFSSFLSFRFLYLELPIVQVVPTKPRARCLDWLSSWQDVGEELNDLEQDLENKSNNEST